VENTIQAYVTQTDITTLQMEQRVAMTEVFKNPRLIPVFTIIKVTKVIRNPMFNKEEAETTKNRKNITIEVLEINTEITDKQLLTMLLMNVTKVDQWLLGRFIPEKLWQSDSKRYYEYALEHAVWSSKIRKIPIYKAHISVMNGILDVAVIPGIQQLTGQTTTLLGHMEKLEGMFENDNANQPLIYSVESTMTTHTEGKWFILSHATQVPYVLDWFNQEFDRL
jgi:hypothetical protein